MRLENRRALIFGAAPGNLGAAIARRLKSEGAAVAVAARRDDALTKLREELGVVALRCDLNDLETITPVVDEASRRLGGLDIGVNAAAWGLLKPFLEMTTQEIDRMARLQFTAAFRVLQAFVGAMTRGGAIVQISSVTATIMMDDHAAYMGTKAGIDHVVRCVANEFGSRGIRANSVAPNGIADTPMSGGGLDLPAMRSLYAREIPLERPCTSKDVADAVAWLASDEASYVTGQTIHVSGGQTLRRNPSMKEIVARFGAAQ